MSLSSLIRNHLDVLVDEWSAYAHDHVEVASRLSKEALQDSTRALFTAIANDMETSQTSREQAEKSWGKRSGNSAGITEHALQHAEHRLTQGFTLMDVISEFRAARASVMRLWLRDNRISMETASEITRFNESIDEAISVSVADFDRQLEKSRDLFLGVLGHDMRSPLGAIMLLAQLILKDPALSGSSLKAASKVHASGTRLRRMLDDLIDFTRTRLGKNFPLAVREGDLGLEISMVVDELRAHHPGKIIHFETSGELHGRWDFGRLAQVLANLGGNAIQHGAASECIDIKLAGLADRVEMSVHNFGDPIPSLVLGRIFDPLTRGCNAATADSGSMGLGLYICRQVALAHGGSINVESTDAGITFKVSIPR